MTHQFLTAQAHSIYSTFCVWKAVFTCLKYIIILTELLLSVSFTLTCLQIIYAAYWFPDIFFLFYITTAKCRTWTWWMIQMVICMCRIVHGNLFSVRDTQNYTCWFPFIGYRAFHIWQIADASAAVITIILIQPGEYLFMSVNGIKCRAVGGLDLASH